MRTPVTKNTRGKQKKETYVLIADKKQKERNTKHIKKQKQIMLVAKKRRSKTEDTNRDTEKVHTGKKER